MPTVSQLPAQLDAECVAGDPFSIAVTSSGAAITSPTVTLKNALGATITSTVPTVTQVGAVTTVSFSSSTTAALNTNLTRPVSLLWSLSALVDGAGPFQLVARQLTIYPVGTAGVSSTSSATLAVTVGGAAVSLAVALGGVNGGVGVPASAFGVVADGVTDDTAAWASAIAAAAAAKVPLVAPVGISIVAGISLLSGTTIVGQGKWSSTLKLKAATNGPLVSLATDVVQHTHLENLVLDGNRANQSSANARGIYYNNTDTWSPSNPSGNGDMYHRVADCVVRDTYGNGLFIDGRGESKFDSIYFLTCGYGGSGSAALYVNTFDLFFSNITVGTSGGHGIHDLGGNNQYVNCKVYLSGGSAPADDWYIESTTNRITGCMSQGSARHSLHINGGADNIIEGFTAMDPNYTSANSGVCFLLNNANRNKISGVGMKSADPENPTPYQLLAITSSGNNRIELVGDPSDFTGGLWTAASATGGAWASNRVVVNGNDGWTGTTYAAAITPDLSRGSVHGVTLTGNVTVNRPLNMKDGDRLLLIFTQDATGGRSVTWGTGFPDKTATVTSAANAVTAVEFVSQFNDLYRVT
jgi:hypothetical protein